MRGKKWDKIILCEICVGPTGHISDKTSMMQHVKMDIGLDRHGESTGRINRSRKRRERQVIRNIYAIRERPIGRYEYSNLREHCTINSVSLGQPEVQLNNSSLKILKLWQNWCIFRVESIHGYFTISYLKAGTFLQCAKAKMLNFK